ncbi:MAG TPA: helix-turn-helix domain-containing protein [Ktedonobacteraceae bacterium]|jgi:predicted DNA-binding transcriptional regulator AlpA|nr:helix-turn-helix domain-containing protein [Ktedonobacteraceae bacterium]
MMEKAYYTPEEVMKLLGISKATLNRRAEDGTIPSELEAGRKRGRKYPKEAIDAHVKLLKRKHQVKLTFGPATNSELWASYQNHLSLYEPEDIVTYDRLLEWREANYDIFMSAREGGKRIAGVTMMPLEEEVILSLINEEIREQDIPSEAIQPWTEKNLTVYIPSISIHHTGNAIKDRERGHFIIRSAIRWAFALDKHYDIQKWYAIAATPEGKKLVQHLGFEKIAGKRDAYLLTNLSQAVGPIKAFIERLEQEDEPLVPLPKRRGRVGIIQHS